MDNEYENEYLDNNEYYSLLDESDWLDYVGTCIDYGCLSCGHEIQDGGELNDYRGCIYCEDEL